MSEEGSLFLAFTETEKSRNSERERGSRGIEKLGSMNWNWSFCRAEEASRVNLSFLTVGNTGSRKTKYREKSDLASPLTLFKASVVTCHHLSLTLSLSLPLSLELCGCLVFSILGSLAYLEAKCLYTIQRIQSTLSLLCFLSHPQQGS